MAASPKSKYVFNYVLPKELGRTRGNWKCDKCQKTFSSWEVLRLHKREVHSY